MKKKRYLIKLHIPEKTVSARNVKTRCILPGKLRAGSGHTSEEHARLLLKKSAAGISVAGQ